MKLNIFDYGDSLLFEVETYPIKPFEERPEEPDSVDYVKIEILKDGEKIFSDIMDEHTDSENEVVPGKYRLSLNTYDEFDDYGDYKIQIVAVKNDSKQVLTDYLKLKKTYLNDRE